MQIFYESTRKIQDKKRKTMNQLPFPLIVPKFTREQRILGHFRTLIAHYLNVNLVLGKIIAQNNALGKK